MDLRNLSRRLAPPVLLEVVRKLRRTYYIWQGVYRCYANVPRQGAGFQDELYVATAREQLRRLLERRAAYQRVPTDVVGEDAVLPLVAAVLCHQNRHRVTILDFGGGLAQCYVNLRQSLPDCGKIDYHVVDMEWAVREGSSLFTADASIHFHSTLPSNLGRIDVALLRGVLNYIEDYPSLLKQLGALRPCYILLVNLAAGAFPTFASGQLNHRGSVIPYWFFNLSEIEELLGQEGYSLIFKGAHEDYYDQSNFPLEYRLEKGHACNLLFARRIEVEPCE